MSITIHRNTESPLCRWTANDVIAAIRKYRMTHVRLLLGNVPNARVFLKYGEPDVLAKMIAEGAKDIFFQNGKTVMTQDYLMMPENPESFVLLKNAVLAYGEIRAGAEYLIVQDCWGEVFRYPFSAGQKQVFKIRILLDKIEKAAKNCRIGNTPENQAYAKSHRIPLERFARK